MFWKVVLGQRGRRRRRRPQLHQVHYKKHKELARQKITARVLHFSSTHGFTYGRIAIRNSRRSWGSCSSIGNLNFHYRLIFLPPELLDYVVVHELCHLRVFNHSADFWSEVEAILPDYVMLRATLRQYEKGQIKHAMMTS